MLCIIDNVFLCAHAMQFIGIPIEIEEEEEPIEIDDTLEGYDYLLMIVGDQEDELREMAMSNAILLATMAMHPHYNDLVLCYLAIIFGGEYDVSLLYDVTLLWEAINIRYVHERLLIFAMWRYYAIRRHHYIMRRLETLITLLWLFAIITGLVVFAIKGVRYLLSLWSSLPHFSEFFGYYEMRY